MTNTGIFQPPLPPKKTQNNATNTSHQRWRCALPLLFFAEDHVASLLLKPPDGGGDQGRHVGGVRKAQENGEGQHAVEGGRVAAHLSQNQLILWFGSWPVPKLRVEVQILDSGPAVDNRGEFTFSIKANLVQVVKNGLFLGPTF